MAYTSIIPVHRLDRSIDYIKDKKKTAQKAENARSLEEAVDYAMNREKTERPAYEDSIGCTCNSAFADMVATKKRFHKLDGVQGYHLIQSFAAGEVTPELAHLIGQELAEQLLKGRFEAVITTHLNTTHCHNHIVFNSVSMVDGRKYHSNEKSYYEEIRKISDGLCVKYGLSVIPENGSKGKSYAQWQAEKDGRPTWRTAIRMDIREAVQESFTWKQFLVQMEHKGYEWKLDRKYPALKAPGMERFVRLKSLGTNYTEEKIQEWILKPKEIKHTRSTQPGLREWSKKQGSKSAVPRRKLTGLQALYYSYLYQMGVLKKRPPRIPGVLREDIRRLDKRVEQMEFLQKHGITTREQLAAFQMPREQQMVSLLKERRRLYRREPDSPRIGEITEQLKKLRKDIKMSAQIETHSREMEERLRRAEQQEKQENNQKPGKEETGWQK
nr:relaxase/mobilization nuclease domain-containing protein [uncultured Schaedlerella sp.]